MSTVACCAPMSVDFPVVEFQTGGAAVNQQSFFRRQSPCPEVTYPSKNAEPLHQYQNQPYAPQVVASRRNDPYANAADDVLSFSPPPMQFSNFYPPSATVFVDLPEIFGNPQDCRSQQISNLAHKYVFDYAREHPGDIALLHLQKPSTMAEALRLQEKFFTMETFFNPSCCSGQYKKNYSSSPLFAGLSPSQFDSKLKKLEEYLTKSEDFVPFLAGQVTFEYCGLAGLGFILQMMYPEQPPAKIVPIYIKKDDCLRLYVHRSMVNQLKAAHRCRLLCDRHGWMYLAQSDRGVDILRRYGDHQSHVKTYDWKVSRYPITIEEKKETSPKKRKN